MSSSGDDEEEIFIPQEGSTESNSFHLLKTDNELYLEEENVPHKLINVKRVRLPRGGEDWEILENNKVVLLLKGTRFTSPEKQFLRTADGMKFLISEYKGGKKSVVKIKAELKNKI